MRQASTVFAIFLLTASIGMLTDVMYGTLQLHIHNYAMVLIIIFMYNIWMILQFALMYKLKDTSNLLRLKVSVLPY